MGYCLNAQRVGCYAGLCGACVLLFWRYFAIIVVTTHCTPCLLSDVTVATCRSSTTLRCVHDRTAVQTLVHGSLRSLDTGSRMVATSILSFRSLLNQNRDGHCSLLCKKQLTRCHGVKLRTTRSARCVCMTRDFVVGSLCVYRYCPS